MIEEEIYLRNNTGSKSKSAIINGFVVRTNEYEEILYSLGKPGKITTGLNILIFGQRGAGKTTLMHRLNYAILDDSKLRDRYLPILFSEEQYNLSDLTNLWESTAIEIEDNHYQEGLTQKIQHAIETVNDYEEASYQILHDFLISKGKSAILFIENLNFFLNKLSKSEKKRLLSLITSDSPIKIIGSSVSYHDGSIDFDNPEYSIFQKIQLNGLTKEECTNLLLRIGQQHGEEEEIARVIYEHPGRVESLRRLTGGVPRTISYLFQIFLDNENGKAIKDLYKLIDTLTLLYKAELDQLSAQQQKVIDAIAKNWDAVSVKDIAKRTRLESKNISSILAHLERNQFVEKTSTPTKNHLYAIKDRFLNIWYLMRFGRKNDKENVVWLVRFFDAWCDESELTKRILRHLENLKGGKYDPLAAIDMGNTFLSCENVPENLKEELIKTTNQILASTKDRLPYRILKNTKKKDQLAEVEQLIKNDKFEEAETLLNSIQNRDFDYYSLSISLYLSKNDFPKAKEAASIAWEMNNKNSSAAITMGLMHETYTNELEKAIEFYKIALELPNPHPYAANRLGNIFSARGEYEQAIKYHTIAIGKKILTSLKSLGDIYLEMNQLEKAEKHLRNAVKEKVDGAYVSLALTLSKQKKRKEVEAVLKQAVENNEKSAHINLGRFYMTGKRPELEKAEALLLIAVQNNETDAYNYLAKIADRKNNREQAIDLYKKGVTLGNSDSAHQLAHYFQEHHEFRKADHMFEKAIELGDTLAIACWAISVYSANRKSKRSLIIKLFNKHRTQLDDISIDLIYAKFLLWDNRLNEALNIINDSTAKINESLEDSEGRDSNRTFSNLVEFFSLLIAKKEYDIALALFSGEQGIDFKAILKPVYYVLMEELKDSYPSEYLKAGKELKETIEDLKKEVSDLRESILKT